MRVNGYALLYCFYGHYPIYFYRFNHACLFLNLGFVLKSVCGCSVAISINYQKLRVYNEDRE